MPKIREHVIDYLLNSPMAKEAEQRHTAAISARRAMLAKERAAMEKNAVADYHAHEKAVATAFAEHQAAAAALKTAKEKLGSLHSARYGACYNYDRRVSEIEGELRETADPSIADFIGELREAHEVAPTRAECYLTQPGSFPIPRRQTPAP